MTRREEKENWQKRRRCDEALEGYDYNSNSSNKGETEGMEFITAL